MPPKNPGTSYTGKPVRRLKLPKTGPTKTQNLFEEYFYTLLAVVFFAVAILAKAGGFSGYNALIVAAWTTAFLWFANQLRGYFAEKSKAENGKSVTPPATAPAKEPKGPLPLPPSMKPMIGPQWPVKPGARPSWPKLPKQQPVTAAAAQTSLTPVDQTPTVQDPGAPATGTNSDAIKRAFVYERPTLPDRKPKLPYNWANMNDKKQKDKKRKNKKPKR